MQLLQFNDNVLETGEGQLYSKKCCGNYYYVTPRQVFLMKKNFKDYSYNGDYSTVEIGGHLLDKYVWTSSVETSMVTYLVDVTEGVDDTKQVCIVVANKAQLMEHVRKNAVDCAAIAKNVVIEIHETYLQNFLSLDQRSDVTGMVEDKYVCCKKWLDTHYWWIDVPLPRRPLPILVDTSDYESDDDDEYVHVADNTSKRESLIELEKRNEDRRLEIAKRHDAIKDERKALIQNIVAPKNKVVEIEDKYALLAQRFKKKDNKDKVGKKQPTATVKTYSRNNKLRPCGVEMNERNRKLVMTEAYSLMTEVKNTGREQLMQQMISCFEEAHHGIGSIDYELQVNTNNEDAVAKLVAISLVYKRDYINFRYEAFSKYGDIWNRRFIASVNALRSTWNWGLYRKRVKEGGFDYLTVMQDQALAKSLGEVYHYGFPVRFLINLYVSNGGNKANAKENIANCRFDKIMQTAKQLKYTATTNNFNMSVFTSNGFKKLPNIVKKEIHDLYNENANGSDVKLLAKLKDYSMFFSKVERGKHKEVSFDNLAKEAIARQYETKTYEQWIGGKIVKFSSRVIKNPVLVKLDGVGDNTGLMMSKPTGGDVSVTTKKTFQFIDNAADFMMRSSLINHPNVKRLLDNGDLKEEDIPATNEQMYKMIAAVKLLYGQINSFNDVHNLGDLLDIIVNVLALGVMTDAVIVDDLWSNISNGSKMFYDTFVNVIVYLLTIASDALDIKKKSSIPISLNDDSGEGVFIPVGDNTSLTQLFEKIRSSEALYIFRNVAMLGVPLYYVFKSFKGDIPDKSLKDVLLGWKSLLAITDMAAFVSKLPDVINNQILPTIYYQDTKFLKPQALEERLVLMDDVIVLGENGFSGEEMSRIIIGWRVETLPANLGDHELRIRLKDVVIDMIEFLREKHSDKTGILSKMQQLSIVKTKLQNQINGVIRHRPFGVFVVGPPGTHKTTWCSTTLPNVVADVLGLPIIKDGKGQLRAEPTVNLNPSDKFFENCTGSTAVIGIDDAGIVQDDAAIASMLATTFNIQGSTPTQIVHANLLGKSGQVFGNKLTWGTANSTAFDKGLLLCQAAFWRRFDVFVNQIPITLNKGADADPRFSAEIWMLDYDLQRPILQYVYKMEDIFVETRTIADSKKWFYDQVSVACLGQAELYVQARVKAEEAMSTGTQLCGVCKHYNALCICNGSRLKIENTLSKFRVHKIAHLNNWFEPFLKYIPLPLDYSIWLTTGVEDAVLDQLYTAYPVLRCVSWALRMFPDLMVNRHRTRGWLFNAVFLSFFDVLALKVPFMSTLVRYLHLFINLRPWAVANNRSIEASHSVQIEVSRTGIDIIVDRAALVKELSCEIANSVNTRYPYLKYFAVACAIMPTVYIVSRAYVANVEADNTGMTDLADAEDRRRNEQLQSMVKSIEPPISLNGKVQSFSTCLHSIKLAGSGINKYVKTMVVTIKVFTNDGIQNGKGTFGPGGLYIPRHMVEKTGQVKGSYTTLNGGLSGTFSGCIQDGTLILYCGDNAMVVMTPIPGANKVPIAWDFDLSHLMEYEFIVGGSDKVIKPLYALDGVMVNNIKDDNPYIVMNVEGNYSDSGLPIYTHKRNGKTVEKMLIGIQSKRLRNPDPNGLGYMMVSPFWSRKHRWDGDGKCVADDTMLTRPLNQNIVTDYFKKTGYKLKTQIDKRSIFNHLTKAEFEAMGEYVGSMEKHPVRCESHFSKSVLYDKTMTFSSNLSLYGIPKLHHFTNDAGEWVNSMVGAIRQMSTCGEPIFEQPFIAAAHICFKHILPVLHDQLTYVRPLFIHEVIRGTSHTNPLRLDASCGFPMSGKIKADLVKGPLEEPCFTADYAVHLMEVLKHIDEKGYTFNIAVASLKDEIIKQSKIDDGLERVFFSGNADFLMLCRMYLSPLCDLFMANRDVLFAQIGMNAIGSEFHERLQYMYQRIVSDFEISKFLFDVGWMDADYSKYDKRLLVLAYGVYVMWLLVQECPYYKDPDNIVELLRVEAILKAFGQYIMIIGNEVFIMHNKMPSGVFGTAIINCICECILQILQFYYCLYIFRHPDKQLPTDFVAIGSEEVNFFNVVSLINYGDDNLKYVSSDYRQIYTNQNIKRFAEAFAIEITSANKEDSLEFKTVTRVQFLKRTPYYDYERKLLIGLLDFNSIVKMLGFTDSLVEDWKELALDQAGRELSYYPLDTFERFCEVFCLELDHDATRDRALGGQGWGKDKLTIVFDDASADDTVSAEVTRVRGYKIETDNYISSM